MQPPNNWDQPSNKRHYMHLLVRRMILFYKLWKISGVESRLEDCMSVVLPPIPGQLKPQVLLPAEDSTRVEANDPVFFLLKDMGSSILVLEDEPHLLFQVFLPPVLAFPTSPGVHHLAESFKNYLANSSTGILLTMGRRSLARLTPPSGNSSMMQSIKN